VPALHITSAVCIHAGIHVCESVCVHIYRGAIPPFPQYAFMAWCLVKIRDNFVVVVVVVIIIIIINIIIIKVPVL
jgi:hypothetical protein